MLGKVSNLPVPNTATLPRSVEVSNFVPPPAQQ